MVKRTYSRRSQTPQTRLEDQPAKRRRVEISSDPISPRLSPIISSDGIEPLSTPTPGSRHSILHSSPPSSPPPSVPRDLKNSNTLEPLIPPPRFLPTATRTEPLKETTGNARKIKPLRQQKLTQLTLDLGQKTQRKCQTCGMEYRPSSPEDAALHKKFHAQNVGGIDLGKKFVDSIFVNQKVWSGSGEMIVVVNRSVEARKRRVVESVLDVVEKELGGVGIDREELWSEMLGTSETDPTAKCDRYKAYLYIRGYKCVGVCLTERIRKGYEVQVPDTEQAKLTPQLGTRSSSIMISSNSTSATLGVSRIWTSTFARRSGVARKMLDSALDNFVYGMKVSKDMVAFSQPTQSGGNLARSWFGKESGWLVYKE